MRAWIALTMMVVPLVASVVFVVWIDGFRVAAMIYGGIAVLFTWVWAAIYVARGTDNPLKRKDR